MYLLNTYMISLLNSGLYGGVCLPKDVPEGPFWYENEQNFYFFFCLILFELVYLYIL